MAKRTKKNKQGGRGLSRSRKLEILGILVMAVATLVAISIVTYHETDYAIIQSLTAQNLVDIGQGPALRVQNGLGVAGAYLSYFFVYMLFGYTSIIIPVLLFAYGWFVFRDHDIHRLAFPTAYGLWSMVLLSSILGWISSHYDWFSSLWNGSAGIALARILENITGLGSIIILGVLAVITLLLPLDRDMQHTIDAVKAFFTNIRDRWNGWKERRRQRREEKKRKREERRKMEAKARAEEAEMEEEEEPKEGDGEQLEPAEEEGEEDKINKIVEASDAKDRERRQQEQEEVKELDQRPPRAILDKDEKEKAEGEEDDVDINVYVGKGEEEADEKELERQNRTKAKEAPVIKYKFPGIDLLDAPPNEGNEVDMEEIRENKRIILEKLKRHKIDIRSINAIVGPTVTLYELDPAPDVKISKIESYANDLKMATASHGLRIIAPIPGRSAVGIEVPNGKRETVYIKQVLNTRKFVDTEFELPIAFGKTIENEVFMRDLAKMPHLLIAGATGSGKTVGINTIITCLLYKCHPENLKFVMVDPKKIELSLYRNIQNHFLATLPGSDEPIVTDNTKALETLQSVCKEMDERYDLLKMAMVRDIREYNKKYDDGELEDDLGHRHLPYIVVVIDELADLMMTAGKQIEEPITRLAQLARAVGIHLVVATQRPSVNVITGTIKANFPARVAYQVASKVDSRTILDTMGADQLVGNGDMLFTNGGGMTRIQNAYVSTAEVERITGFIGKQPGYKQPFHLPVIEDESGGIPDPLEERDELFEDAARVVVMNQQGSVSLLQRRLKLGYNRAGRIIDQLYAAGVVGPYQGSTARDVLVDTEEELEEKLKELDD